MEAERMNNNRVSVQVAPRFSVIIPAYNAARTLAHAIDSVLSQTWPAHEIIVVDDGSSDNTFDIAMGFGNTVRVIQQSNAGVAVARNRGVQIASGDWLAFLDADDWYYPDRLRYHAAWIARDPDLDFLTGDYDYRCEDGNLIGTSMVDHPSGRAMLEKAGEADEVVMEAQEFEVFVADHFGDTHTLSIPRKTFLTIGGYPPGFKVCEDVHLLARLCTLSQRVGVVCRPLGVYLIHQNSVTRSDRLAAQKHNVQTLLDLMRLSSDYPPPVKRGIRTRLRNGRLNLGYALVRAGKRWQAMGAVLPSLIEAPGWTSLRNLMSMLKG